MTVKKRFQLGDIFLVEISDTEVKYFQYISNDPSQLYSDVIRVFRKKYLREEPINFDELAKSDIDFHAHCIIKWGIKMNTWIKVGNCNTIEDVKNILFRDTNDYGQKPGELIDVSYNWYIWKIGEKFIKVGKLEGANRYAEIGIVVNPYSIVHRIKTGNYDFFYPKYI